MNRIYEFWAGEQRSGKTYRLKKRIRALSSLPHIRSILICDRIGEYTDCTKHTVEDARDLMRYDRLPRVVAVQAGLDASRYRLVFDTAISEGDCVVVIDEAYDFFPPGSTWRGFPELQQIVLAGRHLRTAAGDLRATHLLVATQYPRTVHHLVWSQASAIYTGRLNGDNAAQWIRGNFGADALLKNCNLGKHEFQQLR